MILSLISNEGHSEYQTQFVPHLEAFLRGLVHCDASRCPGYAQPIVSYTVDLGESRPSEDLPTSISVVQGGFYCARITHTSSPERRPPAVQRRSFTLWEPCGKVRRTNSKRDRGRIEWVRSPCNGTEDRCKVESERRCEKGRQPHLEGQLLTRREPREM